MVLNFQQSFQFGTDLFNGGTFQGNGMYSSESLQKRRFHFVQVKSVRLGASLLIEEGGGMRSLLLGCLRLVPLPACKLLGLLEVCSFLVVLSVVGGLFYCCSMNCC